MTFEDHVFAQNNSHLWFIIRVKDSAHFCASSGVGRTDEIDESV
jgi:hypothetical protein